MKLSSSEVLGVIQVGATCDYPLDTLKNPISTRFPWFRVETVAPFPNPDEAYDSHRTQYHSTRILTMLEEHIRSLIVDRVLGVAAFDLYVPGMNFVFGEARRPGRVGIISTRRLKPPPPDASASLEERVVKEAIHEIGHMLGLTHCLDDLCVMHFSEWIGDTDRKSANLCKKCQSELRRLRVE